MNTALAIILSQLPLAIFALLFYVEFRKISAGLAELVALTKGSKK